MPDIIGTEATSTERYDLNVAWSGEWFVVTVMVNGMMMGQGTGRSLGQALIATGELMAGKQHEPIFNLPGQWKITLEPIK